MDFLRELVRLLLLRVRQALEESGDPHAQDAVFLNRRPGTRAEWEREWNELQMRPECGRYRWLRARCGTLGGWVLDLTVAALAEPVAARCGRRHHHRACGRAVLRRSAVAVPTARGI